MATLDALRQALDQLKPLDPLVLQVERDGKLMFLTLSESGPVLSRRVPAHARSPSDGKLVLSWRQDQRSGGDPVWQVIGLSVFC
jgi:hypothetical protein